MHTSLNHAQTSRLAVLGSSTHCGGGPDEALGREAREVVHPHCLGNAGTPKVRAAVAMVRLVATGRTYRFSFARGVPAAERCCRSILPDTGGRRSACSASRLRQIALNPSRALTRCDHPEPTRIDPYGFQPAVHPSHLKRLSSVASFEKQLSERRLEPCSRNRGMSYLR